MGKVVSLSSDTPIKHPLPDSAVISQEVPLKVAPKARLPVQIYFKFHVMVTYYDLKIKSKHGSKVNI